MGGIKKDERGKGEMEGEGGMRRDDRWRKSEQEAGEGGEGGDQVSRDKGHLKSRDLHHGAPLVSVQLGHVEAGCPHPSLSRTEMKGTLQRPRRPGSFQDSRHCCAITLPSPLSHLQKGNGASASSPWPSSAHFPLLPWCHCLPPSC